MNSYRNSEEKTKDYSKSRCLVRRKIHWNSSCKSKKRKSSCCSTRYCKKQCCRSGGRTRCHGTSRRWGKWIFFFSTSRNVLPIFGTYCPVRGLITMTAVQFSHFQIQGLIDARRAVTVSMHAVKFLYTTLLYRSAPVFHSRSSWYNSRHVVRGPKHAVKFLYTSTFHFGLKIGTLCFLRGKPDASAVTWTWPWHYTVDDWLLLGGRLLVGRCTHSECPKTQPVDATASFLISYRQ